MVSPPQKLPAWPCKRALLPRQLVESDAAAVPDLCLNPEPCFLGHWMAAGREQGGVRDALLVCQASEKDGHNPGYGAGASKDSLFASSLHVLGRSMCERGCC